MSLCAEMIQILRCRGMQIKPKVYVCRAAEAKSAHNVVCNIYEIVNDDNLENVVANIIEIEVKIDKKNLMRLIFANEKVQHIIILINEISHPSQKAIAEITSKKVELIRRRDIAWDKTKYINVAHYELLTPKQISDFETKRKKKIQNINHMLTSDPVAVQYGFRAGDVVRAIEYDTYRYVVKDPLKEPK